MDLIKLVSALTSRTFLFLQNDTKIVDFGEGVLSLEPFFYGNVIFKICSFCIKSNVWGREEFLRVAPPDCNDAMLRNECFSLLFMVALLYKARADNLPGEAKQWKMFGTCINCDIWDTGRRANLENNIASEKRPQNQNALIIKINNLAVILLGFFFNTYNVVCNNAHNFFILSLVFLQLVIVHCKYCILFGPPCICTGRKYLGYW